MPYVYDDVDALVKDPYLPNVGTGQCVALVEKYAKAPAPANKKWKQGGVVRGNTLLKKGTAIATFKNGVYQSLPHGNHAALYYSQDGAGLIVVDQYQGSGGIRKRRINFKGKAKDGSYVTPSSNGDAFSVIE